MWVLQIFALKKKKIFTLLERKAKISNDTTLKLHYNLELIALFFHKKTSR